MIRFEPLRRDHFPLMSEWLARPHVLAWWEHDPDPAAVESDFGPTVDGTDPTLMFVVHVDDDPVGFVQCYRYADEPEWLAAVAEAGVTPDCAGMDYFIGEESLIGRGLGVEVLGALVERIWAQWPDVVAIAVDIDPENRRSWRVLEKLGFRRVWTGRLDASPDPRDHGPAVMYRLDRP